MEFTAIILERTAAVLSKILFFGLFGLLASCAVTSGFHAGDLPQSGRFLASNGMQFHIQPLSLANLPTASLPTTDHNNSSLTNHNGYTNHSLSSLLKPSNQADYRITAGDILSIALIDYPEIIPAANTSSSNPYASGFAVDQQGYIQFPLIGRVKAGGLSVSQFTAKLRAQLETYLKYPDPQVKVINYRGKKYFVDGAVKQSGEFNMADAPVSLVEAISMAGGALASGDSNSIELTRQGMRYQLGLRNLQDQGVSPNQIYLQDGDALHINNRDRNKVYVLGEFGEIEPLEIPEQGLSLAHVLGESKGLDAETADAAKVYVVRDRPGQRYTDIYYVDMRSVTNFALANRFKMQSDDIIYVDPTGITRWSRFIESILPSASAISLITGL